MIPFFLVRTLLYVPHTHTHTRVYIYICIHLLFSTLRAGANTSPMLSLKFLLYESNVFFGPGSLSGFNGAGSKRATKSEKRVSVLKICPDFLAQLSSSWQRDGHHRVNGVIFIIHFEK
jgi:hypothetical protein